MKAPGPRPIRRGSLGRGVSKLRVVLRLRVAMLSEEHGPDHRVLRERLVHLHASHHVHRRERRAHLHLQLRPNLHQRHGLRRRRRRRLLLPGRPQLPDSHHPQERPAQVPARRLAYPGGRLRVPLELPVLPGTVLPRRHVPDGERLLLGYRHASRVCRRGWLVCAIRRGVWREGQRPAGRVRVSGRDVLLELSQGSRRSTRARTRAIISAAVPSANSPRSAAAARSFQSSRTQSSHSPSAFARSRRASTPVVSTCSMLA